MGILGVKAPMAAAKKRRRKNSKNTLVVVMASVVALGMILSTLFLYIDYMRKPNYPDSSGSQNNLPDIEKQLQAEQENLELEAEQLAQYIEEYGPSEAVLMQLGAIYGALAEYAHVLD